MHHESDLVAPAIVALRLHGGHASTKTLRTTVKRLVKLYIEDVEILPSRTDQRVDQIIRNLKSHRRLDKFGLAHSVPGGFALTRLGLFIDDQALVSFSKNEKKVKNFMDNLRRILPKKTSKKTFDNIVILFTDVIS